jgi:hypothetical protein
MQPTGPFPWRSLSRGHEIAADTVNQWEHHIIGGNDTRSWLQRLDVMLQAMAAAEVIRKSEARYTALCTDNDRANEIAVLVAEDATWPVRR